MALQNFSISVLALAVVACGGGGSDDSAPPANNNTSNNNNNSNTDSKQFLSAGIYPAANGPKNIML